MHVASVTAPCYQINLYLHHNKKSNLLHHLQHYVQLSLPYELENEEHQKKYVFLRSDGTNDSQVTGATIQG